MEHTHSTPATATFPSLTTCTATGIGVSGGIVVRVVVVRLIDGGRIRGITPAIVALPDANIPDSLPRT